MNFKDLRSLPFLSDITTEELSDAVVALLEQGFIKEIVNEITGEISYQITELGNMVKDHIGSDEKTRN
jgi:nucleoside-diphosphate-sugar epimerase